jgi:superfamily I DNA/RNA helicase
MTHITIEAGPGTGKSSTLEYAYNYLLTKQYSIKPTQEQVNICGNIGQIFAGINPSQIVFIAFNVTTRDHLQERLPAATKAYTFNGLGQSLIQRRHGFQKLDATRGQKILSSILGRNLTDLPYKERLEMYALLKYVSHCKEELLTPSPESFHTIYCKYNIAPPPENIELATKLMQLMTIPNGFIEYIDQVWMGLQLLKQPAYELAFIDEAQDLSQLRLEFSLRVAKHAIFCGDGYQSINAFAGADHKAFEKLESVSTFTMPLKTSFRLPPNHIEHANKVRPARILPFKTVPGPIEACSLSDLPTTILSNMNGRIYTVKWKPDNDNPIHDAPLSPAPFPPTEILPTTQTRLLQTSQGHITYDPSTNLWTLPPPENRGPANHLIIGRTNAEIFRVAILLLKNRINGQIVRRKEDQDILSIILFYLEDKKKQAKTLPDLIRAVNTDILKAKQLPNKKGALLYEKASCIKYLAEEAQSIEHIPTLLSELTAERTGAIRLCTIHKAKGLEAEFIYILFPPVRHPMAESPQEIEQEINLEFVSETRSKFYKGYVKE